jgi:hypothetical protein
LRGSVGDKPRNGRLTKNISNTVFINITSPRMCRIENLGLCHHLPSWDCYSIRPSLPISASILFKFSWARNCDLYAKAGRIAAHVDNGTRPGMYGKGNCSFIIRDSWVCTCTHNPCATLIYSYFQQHMPIRARGYQYINLEHLCSPLQARGPSPPSVSLASSSASLSSKHRLLSFDVSGESSGPNQKKSSHLKVLQQSINF